jgi:hypothetical protein
MNSLELDSSEYNSYYQPYISAIGDAELLSNLKEGLNSFENFINTIPDEKLSYSYEDGKWSVAEVILHLIDTERIFQYRALRFGRNDKTPLLGFNQDIYVPNSRANLRSKKSITSEYKSVRAATISLFESFDEESLISLGSASGSNMSVRALGFVICGHLQHHKNIIQERYL